MIIHVEVIRLYYHYDAEPMGSKRYATAKLPNFPKTIYTLYWPAIWFLIWKVVGRKQPWLWLKSPWTATNGTHYSAQQAPLTARAVSLPEPTWELSLSLSRWYATAIVYSTGKSHPPNSLSLFLSFSFFSKEVEEIK